MRQSLLSISNLRISLGSRAGKIAAVNGISLDLDKKSTLALVGESGSGKSMTALSVMRLLPSTGLIESGEILFEGEDIVKLHEESMCEIRGSRIAMIFQDPMTSLNPVLKIGDQLSEPLRLHRKMSRKDALEKSVQLMKMVGIQSAENRIYDYSHQLSGGMRQRVMIAMAISCEPALIMADEPTTALDVTIQAEIMELLDALKKSSGMGMLLITHDFGIVAENSEHTAVMYAGRIVETAPTRMLLEKPCHPYTKALMMSLPQNSEPGKPLFALPGRPPDNSMPITGCPFHPRCGERLPECGTKHPAIVEKEPGHLVSCWKHS